MFQKLDDVEKKYEDLTKNISLPSWKVSATKMFMPLIVTHSVHSVVGITF